MRKQILDLFWYYRYEIRLDGIFIYNKGDFAYIAHFNAILQLIEANNDNSPISRIS